jgi:hypothetical protein
MSPVTNRSEAKEGGFAQVRAALIAFEGDVVAQDARGNKTEFAQWGTSVGDDGQPKPPKEYLQISCINVKPTEVTEDLTMDISEGWTFRVNCSDFKGSFWIDAFLLSADKAKVLIPSDLIGKRILFKRFTLKAMDKNGVPNPKYDSTNFIIEKLIGVAGTVTQTAIPTVATTTTASSEAPTVTAPVVDLMDVAVELAVGKTETQFRTAVALNPAFANSPMLGLAKAGAVTQTLVNSGRLTLVQQGTKQVYQKVG